MDETGDTGDGPVGPKGPQDCPVVRGHGCGARELQGAQCTEDGEPEAQVEAAPGDVRGGACGCHQAAGSGWLAGLLLLWWVRRALWAGLWVLSISASTAHAQVDAQQARVIDGGDFVILRDADLGRKWTGALTLGLNHARKLVVIEGVEQPRVLLEQVTTRSVAASIHLGRVTRLGFSAPWHWPATFDGERTRLVPGDLALWIAVPLTTVDNPIRGSWTVQLDLASGAPELYLGNPGVVSGVLALEAPAGPLRAVGNLAVNFHREVPLPGAVYGNHWGYGLGLRAEPAGPLFAVAELIGELPVKVWAGTPTQYPLEALLSVGTVPTRVLSVSGGVGTGLTQGVGSPALRVLGTVDVRPRTPKDADGDGIDDLRDLCRLQPEDVDTYRDLDGCPDPDNDQDGFEDVRDDCPISAENFNDYEDFDGCPERVTFLELVVTGSDGLEQAEVQLGSRPPVRVLPGGPLRRTLELDTVQVTVRGEDHHPHTEELSLTGRARLVHTVVLEAIPFGQLAVRVVDASGDELPDATVALDDAEAVLSSELLRAVAGTRTLLVQAADHRSERVVIEVVADAEHPVTVTLRPARVEVDGNALTVADTVDFALDEAELLDGGIAVVTDLAHWLDTHAEVELLRIEGHADASGTSRHNYDLSLRRAGAVRDLLVELGIDTARLVVVGTGEAAQTDDGRDRRVDFLVLVWADPTP